MKIDRLRVTIEQSHHENHKQTSVEVLTERKLFTVTRIFRESDFETLFGILLDEARREIVRMVKEKITPDDNKL